MKDIKNCY